MQGPATAAVIVIENWEMTRPPIRGVLLLEEVCRAAGWFDGLSDEEIVERCGQWLARFYAKLKTELDSRNADGRLVRYDFNSSDVQFIQGSCFPEPGDSDALKEAKRRRAPGSEYLAAIQSVSPRQFEGVCRGVLELLGCKKPSLTRAANDQGIDFFGVLSLEGLLGKGFGLPNVDRVFKAWLVGQAKQYSGRVSTNELRELAGSVQLARANVYSDGGTALANLRMRIFDPVFYLFLTAGGLTVDTRRLASRSGIIAIDGESVAALLADAKIGEGPDGSFQLSALENWIKSQTGETVVETIVEIDEEPGA